MNKHKSITHLINLIYKKFGKETLLIQDYWDDFYAIGFQSKNKLIYISTYNYKNKPNYYFYECENLLNNSDIPYTVHNKEENIHETKLLQVISNFFNIKPIVKKTKNTGRAL